LGEWLLELHLDVLDIDTGGIWTPLYDRVLGLFDFDTGGSFDRFYNRLLGWNFARWGNFQQLQQWGIDAGDGIYPTLAAPTIALWEHIKLPADFFEFSEPLIL
jgi:hypothetical protein